MPSRSSYGFIALLLLTSTSCNDAPGGVDLSRPVNVDVTADPPRRLSSMNLFAWHADVGFEFNQRVVPYDLNTALFSDYALKQRAIYVPEGASATFDPSLPFDFPVGTVIVKSFSFPADFRAPTENVRMIETRILMRRATGWEPYPYVWNDAQTDAVLTVSGEVRTIPFIDPTGVPRVANYLVPQRNQCQSCHSRIDPDGIHFVPIGTKARHLDRDYDYGGAVGVRNQLAYLAELGMLTGLPDLATITAAYDFRPIEAQGISAVAPADLDFAARSYLDVNCAHCHSPTGVQGVTSQLFLDYENTDLFHLGVCKRPGSAGVGTGGFTFDIVPGDPNTSILYFRMATEEQGAMMPLIGRSVTHTRAAELIHAWIAAMPAQTCL